MIDTDKYEWDSKCRLVVIDGELFQRGGCGDYHIPQQLHDKAVAQIVADAPLFLEEVKRLRGSDERWQTHWEFLRSWLADVADGHISGNDVVKVMDAKRPRDEEE
tara:strand:- start:656 stop:970 length:315 start_codon:yes stop_codon:yes gene_type:complete